MPAEIVLQGFRFGFLILLWLFVFAAFRVVRADLFGGRAGRVALPPASPSSTSATRPSSPKRSIAPPISHPFPRRPTRPGFAPRRRPP